MPSLSIHFTRTDEESKVELWTHREVMLFYGDHLTLVNLLHGFTPTQCDCDCQFQTIFLHDGPIVFGDSRFLERSDFSFGSFLSIDSIYTTEFSKSPLIRLSPL